MKKFFGYLLLIPALLVQCDPADEATPESLIQSQSGVGVLLAEVKTTEGWAVQFLEIEPGTIAMHASLSNDSKDVDKGKMTFFMKGKSIVEIYKTLAKDKINNVQLKALEAANERLQQPASSLPDVDYPAAISTIKSAGTSERVQSNCPVPAGEPDYADDAAAWRDWVNHMDDYGHMVASSANQASVLYEVNCKQVLYYSMASDYVVGAHFAMFYRHDGRWHQYENTYVNPRDWYIHGLWSNKRRLYRGQMTGIQRETENGTCARVNLGYKIIIS